MMNHTGASIVIGLVALLPAGGSHGQDAPVDEAAIEEVIVTATKRATSLQDLPLSVGVLSGEQLDAAGAFRIEDYWRSIPSVNVKDGPLGGNNVVVRGLNDTDSFRQNESLTAFYQDETPLVHLGGLFATPAELALVDVDRVELVRGPQGTLIGANAMGGAVRVISNPPDPTRTEGRVDGQINTTAHGGEGYAVNAVWNQPLNGEDAAIRVAAYAHDQDGYIDDAGLNRKDINGEDLVGMRLAASTRLGDRLDLVARLQAQRREVDGFDFVNRIGRPQGGVFTSRTYETALFFDEGREEDIDIASVTLTWESDWGTLVSATSWLEKSVDLAFDFSPEASLGLPFLVPASGTDSRTQSDVSQEFRFLSRDGPVTWLAGLFYLDQELDSEDRITIDLARLPCADCPFPEVLLDVAGRRTREDLAVFGEIAWRFGNRWEATVGGRWFDTELFQVEIRRGGVIPVDDVPVSGSADGFIGKASLSWAASERLRVYGLVSQGFRPGQLNTGGAIAECGATPTLDSDDLVNFELGARYLSADRRTRVSATLYTLDWSDIQTSILPPDCLFIVVVNSGESSGTGFEFEWTQQVNPRFDLRASFGYTDARLDEPDPALNATPGTPIPHAPRITGSIAATVRFPLGSRFDGFARVDAQYVDSQRIAFDQDFPAELPDYGLMNLSAGIDHGGIRAEWFMDNVFDEAAPIFCCRLLPTGDEPALSRPRTTGIRVLYRF